MRPQLFWLPPCLPAAARARTPPRRTPRPSQPARPTPTIPTIAKVNGVEIRQSDLAIAEEDLGQNPPALSPDSKRDYLITYLADIMLVAKAAEGKKIAETPEFQNRLMHLRNKLLAELMLQAETKAAVTDAAMRKVYDDATKGMGTEQEVRARHILIRVADQTDEKASKEAEDKIKAIIERLNKGEDFAKLASELTEDPSGKQNGGDLDYFTKEQMVPEFSTVAFQLDKGQISGPIKTQFGWHVLKVEDKRNRQPPEFDKVKDQVQTIVMRKAQADFITKLREEAKIERLDKPAAKPAEMPAVKPAEAPAGGKTGRERRPKQSDRSDQFYFVTGSILTRRSNRA